MPQTKRTILITGCSSGCGLDAAHTLRERGWRVFASCRKPEDCEKLISEGFDSPQLDYANDASIRRGFAEVMAATGKLRHNPAASRPARPRLSACNWRGSGGTLDALYNNGAYALLGATEDIPTDALREIFETVSRATALPPAATLRGRA